MVVGRRQQFSAQKHQVETDRPAVADLLDGQKLGVRDGKISRISLRVPSTKRWGVAVASQRATGIRVLSVAATSHGRAGPQLAAHRHRELELVDAEALAQAEVGWPDGDFDVVVVVVVVVVELKHGDAFLTMCRDSAVRLPGIWQDGCRMPAVIRSG